MSNASDIIDRVRAQLVDTGDVQRWSDTELLRWVSDGQRTIALAVPSAASKREAIQLSEGTLQDLPEDAHLLLSVIRNMGTNGTTPGRAVRLVTREVMDAQDPNWHAAPKATVVKNYIFDTQERTSFWVYPPSNGQGYVEANYAYVPGELASTNSELEIRDIWLTALVDYVMYRAHQKDSEFAAGQGVAAGYLQAFIAAVGARGNAESEENPNLQLVGFDPNVRGAAK